MSRTDSHVPHWVKARDPRWRGVFVEDHDHADGVCDLDVYVAANGEEARTNCVMSLHRDGRNHFCGCPMCTDRDWREQARRRERVAWRSLRAQLLAAVDPDAVDAWIPRSGAQ